jgi:hypothetical protein
MKNSMNLEDIIVAIVFLLYLFVAISHAYKSNWPWFIVWASYAMANLGLILASHTK